MANDLKVGVGNINSHYYFNGADLNESCFICYIILFNKNKHIQDKKCVHV